MIAEPGAIVAIPFPFSDLTTRKRRAVLVLSEVDRFGDFAALAVTSAPTRTHAVEITSEVLTEELLSKVVYGGIEEGGVSGWNGSATNQPARGDTPPWLTIRQTSRTDQRTR